MAADILSLEFVMEAPGVAVPTASTGALTDSPALASWLRKALAGEPVTQAERNSLVAHLAWMRDMVATPPLVGSLAHVAVLEAGGGARLVLGARGFEGGDVTVQRPVYASAGAAAAVPTVPAPSGPVPAPPTPPAPPSTPPPRPPAPGPVVLNPTSGTSVLTAVPFTPQSSAAVPPPPQPGPGPSLQVVTEVIRASDRRQSYDALTGALYALRLDAAQVRPYTAPAGLPQLVFLLAGVALVGGLGAYAIYSARQSVADVTRIQEAAQTARVVEQIKGANKDYALYLDCVRAGATCEQSPLMRQPVEVRPAPSPAASGEWARELATSLATTAAYGAVAVATIATAGKVAVTVLDRHDARAERAGRATG